MKKIVGGISAVVVMGVVALGLWVGGDSAGEEKEKGEDEVYEASTYIGPDLERVASGVEEGEMDEDEKEEGSEGNENEGSGGEEASERDEAVDEGNSSGASGSDGGNGSEGGSGSSEGSSGGSDGEGLSGGRGIVERGSDGAGEAVDTRVPDKNAQDVGGSEKQGKTTSGQNVVSRPDVTVPDSGEEEVGEGGGSMAGGGMQGGVAINEDGTLTEEQEAVYGSSGESEEKTYGDFRDDADKVVEALGEGFKYEVVGETVGILNGEELVLVYHERGMMVHRRDGSMDALAEVEKVNRLSGLEYGVFMGTAERVYQNGGTTYRGDVRFSRGGSEMYIGF